MQLILLAFGNTILALVIWVFGTYGLIAGLFASVASGLGVWCVLFIWGSVMGWKNEELSKKVREKREKLRERIWKTLFPFNVYHWIMKKVCNNVCKKECTEIKDISSSLQSHQSQPTETRQTSSASG